LRCKEISESPYAQYLDMPKEAMEVIPYDIGENKLKDF